MWCKDFCMFLLLWTTYLSGIRNNFFLYTCGIDSLCVLCLRIPTTRTGFSTFLIIFQSHSGQKAALDALRTTYSGPEIT